MAGLDPSPDIPTSDGGKKIPASCGEEARCNFCDCYISKHGCQVGVFARCNHPKASTHNKPASIQPSEQVVSLNALSEALEEAGLSLYIDTKGNPRFSSDERDKQFQSQLDQVTNARKSVEERLSKSFETQRGLQEVIQRQTRKIDVARKIIDSLKLAMDY